MCRCCLEPLLLQMRNASDAMLQLSAVAQLTQLTHLAYSGSPPLRQDANIGHPCGLQLSCLTNLQQLCELELRDCVLVGGSAAAAALERLGSLVRLDLSDNPLSLEMIAGIGSISSLVSGPQSIDR
jgi:hypothetical protein